MYLPPNERIRSGWRGWLQDVIFGTETRLGRTFDIALIVAIVGSVIAVMLESVASFRAQYQEELYIVEWAFTILFTVEYALRMLSSEKPRQYATSFFGVIDLLALLPTYASLFVPGAQYLLVIRLLRILRVFRVLKLASYLDEADTLMMAIRASRRKISVFTFAVSTLVVVLGSLMYFVEGPEHGYTSIPVSVYWAIVTLTTVGYGDISPETPLGQFLASAIMLMGYGIIAVPTGIVTVEINRAEEERRRKLEEEAQERRAAGIPMSHTPHANPPRQLAQHTTAARACPTCELRVHDVDADFCKRCGTHLPEYDRT